MKDWVKCDIGDVVELEQGLAINKKTNHLIVDKGLPLLRITDLKNNTQSQFINVDEVPKKFITKPSDIIFTRTGQVGLVFKGKVGVIHNNCFRVIPHENIDINYLYWYLKQEYVKEYANNLASGAAQPDLNHNAFKSIPFSYPPLPTQRKIATILSAYDDLIENNTRRIQILEQIAQDIYREWFVHFRFPGSENFRMVDSRTELGKVPEGWEVQPFSFLVDINPKLIVDKHVNKPYVGMNALSTNSMLIDLGLVEMKTGSSGAKFQNRDVLFPRITPSVENGKAGFVQFLDEDQIAIGSTEIIVFREKELNPEYIYFLSREHGFRGNAINSMVGASGRQRVQPGCFDKYLVAKPPKELIEKFSEIVNPMFEIVHILTKKNANLGATRDLLLPRLVSGDLEVNGFDILS